MDFSSAMQVMDGLLLGDGGLKRQRGGALYGMVQSKPTILMSDHLKWEQWVADNVFVTLGVLAFSHHPKVFHQRRKRGPRAVAGLYACQSLLLTELYDDWYEGGEWAHKGTTWYVHGATKRLPERLMDADKLSIPTLVHWFLGDGGSPWVRPKRGAPYVQVTLSTHCFTEKEVFHLMTMLGNMGIRTIGPGLKPCKRGSGLQIRLSSNPSNVDRFMDLVEPHIMEIFGDSEGPSYKDLVKHLQPQPATAIFPSGTSCPPH